MTSASTTHVFLRFAAAVVAASALAVLGATASPASGASLSRSVDVSGTPAEVWSKIGAFCAIKDWHPAIGSCTENGKVPPTRTLVTKDGAATFVELQTARSATKHRYSYTFLASPLPVTHYVSTFQVTAKTKGISTVTWRGTYRPDAGKEANANAALGGIYEAGLAEIKAKLSK
jgi:hypothetical protein